MMVLHLVLRGAMFAMIGCALTAVLEKKILKW
jgi:hypothetical protein